MKNYSKLVLLFESLTESLKNKKRKTELLQEFHNTQNALQSSVSNAINGLKNVKLRMGNYVAGIECSRENADKIIASLKQKRYIVFYTFFGDEKNPEELIGILVFPPDVNHVKNYLRNGRTLQGFMRA